MSASEGSEDEEGNAPMKAVKKSEKIAAAHEQTARGKKKCTQWIEVDDDQRVKLTHFI